MRLTIYRVLIVTVVILTNIRFAEAQKQIFSTIYFDKNQYVLSDASRRALYELAQRCKSDSFAFMKIYAYADMTGTAEYNKKLSKRRALAVYNKILTSASIDTSNIYVQWLGKSLETYDLHLKFDHAGERAVDILVSFK